MSERGHYADRDNTKQGIYVCTPGGDFLASVNSNDPDRVMSMMREGLTAWKKLRPDQRTAVDESIDAVERRNESSEPKDGLILAVYTRDLPENLDPQSVPGEKWNRDTAWFSKSEALDMIPSKAAVGESVKIPQELVQRLVALHLVDAVKGQTEAFDRDDVTDSEITSTLTGVTDAALVLEFHGQTKCATNQQTRGSSPHGVVTRLFGTAKFDLNTKQFEQFEIVALGRRWGHTQFNFRRQEKRDSNPLGFVIQLAPKDEPPNVPAFFWEYRWMR
jgi:hypothetical protein